MSIATGVFLEYVNHAIDHANDNELCDAVQTIDAVISQGHETRPDAVIKLKEAKLALLKEMGDRIAFALITNGYVIDNDGYVTKAEQ